MNQRPARSRLSMLRRWFYHLIEAGHHDYGPSVAFDWFMTILIICNLVAIAMESVPAIRDAHFFWLTLFDHVSVGVFTLEYLLRLWVSIEHPPVRAAGPVLGRLEFAMRPTMLIDLGVILPYFVHAVAGGIDTRILTLFRILRFLKLARFSPALTTFGRVIQNERHALFGTVMLLTGIAFFCAALLNFVEGDVQPDKFGTIPHAMWWAITTLTTVGYGDAYPVTALGKLIGGLVMMLGVGLFALPIGVLSAGYIEEVRRRDFAVTWGMVARVPLFSHLDAVGISEIMRILHSKVIRRGEIIAYAGEAADCMYFISSGEVELDLEANRVHLTDGDFFGELSLLKQVTRSGTATAVMRTELLVLHAAEFSVLMKRRSEIRHKIMHSVSSIAEARIATAKGDTLPEEARHHGDTETWPDLNPPGGAP